jgi:hypothetical protein
MRQIISITRKTAGRPTLLDEPEGGWTYPLLAEMPAPGVYHVTFGKQLSAEEVDEADQFEQDIGIGHTLGILGKQARASVMQVDSLLKTVREQQELITKLYAALKAQAEPKPDGMSLFAELAPGLKGLLNALADKKVEKTT